MGSRIPDLLLEARAANVKLYFKDGRVKEGILIFNPFRGTGYLLNLEQEERIDFTVKDLRDVIML